MKLGILKGFNDQYLKIVQACEDLEVEYEVIDIVSNKWLDNVQNSNCDGFIVKPPGRKGVWKQMYDERLYFMINHLKKEIYPTFEEILIYENKRVMEYWMRVNNIPHAKTWVFYNKKEALSFIERCNYPLIFKANIASGGIGVEILKSKSDARRLINKIFTKYNFWGRGYIKWGRKNRIPYPMLDDKQHDNLLIQEVLDVKHEWRGVKIGDSYFAHKKLAGKTGLHSGSGEANYDNPPLAVMDFIREICEIGEFRSMNVDFFEDHNGNFYLNELQTFFGSKIKPYQMCVDGEPGRYIYEEGSWKFEKGNFNQNDSNNLRVKDFVKLLDENNVDDL